MTLQLLHDLQRRLHNRVLVLRSIDLILHSISFDILWEASNDYSKTTVERLINAGNKQGIISWMKNHPSLDLEEQSIRYLKDLASRHGIANYSRLNKIELINEIKKRKEKLVL